MTEDFSQFKARFYSRVHDLSVFDCEEYNLLKVVLDGLKVDYLKRGIRHEVIFKPVGITNLLFFAKQLKYRKKISEARTRCERLLTTMQVPFFFLDNGRTALDEAGSTVSFYYHKIEHYLGAANCCALYQNAMGLKKGGELADRLYIATLFHFFSKEERQFIRSLKKAYSNIAALGVFSAYELGNIRVAITKFFDEYRFWKFIFEGSNVRFALFEEHYHREGFMLALKRKGILSVELQHGLIAPEDVFYVFPEVTAPVADRALFPDIMYTYGSYWSEILKRGFEFRPEQIRVLGMYQELNRQVSREQERQLHDFTGGDKFVLVTTQTFLHDHFIDYITWLSSDLLKRSSPVKIVVKNHPAEKNSDYAVLQNLSNVKVLEMNTEYLLNACQWHISCYSTTLYDATKYSCLNFSLWIDRCKDYVETFIKEGISILLYNNQNPIFLEQTDAGITFDKKTLYEDFELHKYKLKQLAE